MKSQSLTVAQLRLFPLEELRWDDLPGETENELLEIFATFLIQHLSITIEEEEQQNERES